MIPVCGDIAMAIPGRRFAKIPTRKRPEESRGILEGRSDFQYADSLRYFRQAHADVQQARLKSAASRRVGLASPQRVPQARAPLQMLTNPAHQVEEMSARRSQRRARAPIRS